MFVNGRLATRTTQPQGAAQIDWSNPITRGLIVATRPFDTLDVINAVDGRYLGTMTTNGVESSTPVAVGIGRNGRTAVLTHDSIVLNRKLPAQTSDFTTFYVGQAPYNGRPAIGLGQDYRGDGWSARAAASASGSSVDFSVIHTSSGAAGSTISGGSISALAACTIAHTFSQADRVQRGYINGATVASGVASGNVLRDSTVGLTCAPTQAGDSNWTTSPYQNVDMLLLFSRALSPSEVAALSANPWQIFKPEPTPLWAPTLTPTPAQAITPTKGALTLTGKSPTVARTAAQAITPTKGALTLTGKAPTVARTAAQAITPAKGALTLTGKAPTVARTAAQAIIPAKGALTLTGKAPTVTQSASGTVAPASGRVQYGQFTPAVAQTANRIVVPGGAHLAVAGKVPSVVQQTPGVGGGATAAEIWGFVLPNGLTAAQTVADIRGYLALMSGNSTLLHDIAQIHGLIPGEPLVVTPTTRSSGALNQTVSVNGDTVTVTRA